MCCIASPMRHPAQPEQHNRYIYKGCLAVFSTAFAALSIYRQNTVGNVLCRNWKDKRWILLYSWMTFMESSGMDCRHEFSLLQRINNSCCIDSDDKPSQLFSISFHSISAWQPLMIAFCCRYLRCQIFTDGIQALDQYRFLMTEGIVWISAMVCAHSTEADSTKR